MSTGGGRNPEGDRFVDSVYTLCVILLFSSVFVSISFGNILPEDVLILVNQDSPTSRYIAKLYLDYHPEIPQENVVYLSGLADSCDAGSTAAEEIITREQYNTHIAEPVRNYLTANNLVTSIKVIVTTAGMPYRIEDTNASYADVIYPGGSNPFIVADYEFYIDAASVESELTCLWFSDYGVNPFGLSNRMVNPYQGYHSSGFDLFERDMSNADQMNWEAVTSLESGVEPPLMEGDKYWYGTWHRTFGPGQMYLASRLDGPKAEGKNPIPAVRSILERAERASNPSEGVNPLQAIAVLDDAPNAPQGNIDRNRNYNLHQGTDYWVFQAGVPQPPDAYKVRMGDDFIGGYEALIDAWFSNENVLEITETAIAHNLPILLDYRNDTATTQSDLDDYGLSVPGRVDNQGVISYANYGLNGDEGKPVDYLTNYPVPGEALFNVVNGAIFTSVESFNAVTMFTDVATTQCKIVDFITIGGCGAIGHSFEPQADAIVDNEFLFYNYLADTDGDGKADLTFIEAAFTAIPYLSWAEVVIGDPLMRICYNDQTDGTAWVRFDGDINFDGKINVRDLRLLKRAMDGNINSSDPALFELYNDLCDLNADGKIDVRDIRLWKKAMENSSVVLGAAQFDRYKGRLKRLKTGEKAI